ncbi:abortive infection family protein [Burkholderia cenocepacia]|uniref:abortive infection family protein n=1 Tax=Burkholderia cenocepacia TaxID=95486 RepID=UPI001E2C23E5|nr:abortive infection family protein [Burkholderia cenocepacia]
MTQGVSELRSRYGTGHGKARVPEGCSRTTHASPSGRRRPWRSFSPKRISRVRSRAIEG